MRKILGSIRKSQVVKASFWSALSTLVRVLSHFVLNKLLAVYVGAAGLGILGQLRSFIIFSEGAATAASTTGVTKYLAEFESEREQREALLSTAWRLTAVAGILCGVLLGCLAQPLSELVFGTDRYAAILRVFSVTVFFYGLNTQLIALLHGLRMVRQAAKVNIAGSLFSLLLVGGLTQCIGLEGAMLGNVLFQLLVCGVCCLMLPGRVRQEFFQLGNYSFPMLKKLGRYAFFSICLLLFSTTDMWIRATIAERISPQAAGNWEAMIRLMLPFHLLVGTLTRSYYMPRIASLVDKQQILRESRQLLSLLFPFLLMAFVTLYMSMDWLIPFLFSEDFAGVSAVLPIYMVGEASKLLAWVFSSYLIAKAKTNLFLLIEVLLIAVYLGLINQYVEVYGLLGIGCIHALVFVLYLFSMFFINKRLVNTKDD